MEIGGYYFSKIQSLTLVLLIMGLVIGLILVQREQDIKIRASIVNNTFDVIQNAIPQEPAVCQGESCTTKTLSIIIKPKIFDNQPKSPVAAKVIPPPPPQKDTSMASCLFTRTGRKAPFGSTILLGWLEDAARRNGVPPAILASFARHESEDITTVSDNDDRIRSNYFCNPGQVFCQCKRPDGGAYAAYYAVCSQESLNAGCKTGRAIGLMQVVDIQNTDLTRDQLCTITTNIERGTRIFISKLSGPANSEMSVKRAVCRYYGEDADYCNYGGGDYAGEVWQDYLNCPAGH